MFALIHPSAWNWNSPKCGRGRATVCSVARPSPPYRGALYAPTFSPNAVFLPLRGILQLVVPEQLRASVLQPDVEGQVLGVAPPPADRARQPPPLGAQPGFAHPHPHADARLFGTHVFGSPSAVIRRPVARAAGGPPAPTTTSSSPRSRVRREGPLSGFACTTRLGVRRTVSPKSVSPKPSRAAPLLVDVRIGLRLCSSVQTNPRERIAMIWRLAKHRPTY